MVLLSVTLDTYKRISPRHDRRWHTLADCDNHYDSDASYFARLRAALSAQMRGEE